MTNLNAESLNDNLTKLNCRFERSKLLRTKLNWKLMKLMMKMYVQQCL